MSVCHIHRFLEIINSNNVDPDEDNNKKIPANTAARKEVIDSFRTIISSLGGISVDVLIPEYEVSFEAPAKH